MTIADLLEEVKTDSSKWMKKRAAELKNFYLARWIRRIFGKSKGGRYGH